MDWLVPDMTILGINVTDSVGNLVLRGSRKREKPHGSGTTFSFGYPMLGITFRFVVVGRGYSAIRKY